VEFIDHDQIVHGIFIATQLLTLRLSTEKVDFRKALEAIAQHLCQIGQPTAQPHAWCTAQRNTNKT